MIILYFNRALETHRNADCNKFSASHLKVILSLLFVLYVAVHVNRSFQSIGLAVIHQE